MKPKFKILKEASKSPGKMAYAPVPADWIHPSNKDSNGVVCIDATRGKENFYIEFGWDRQGDAVVKIWKNVTTVGAIPSTYMGRIDLRSESILLELAK